MKIELEPLSASNRQDVLKIDRTDIPMDYVEDIRETLTQSDYGDDHHLRGCCYVVRCNGVCAGVLLIGEGIPWDCDPKEIQGTFFYRILGFVIDKRFRGRGVGSVTMERAIQNIYDEFGPAPIVIECHRENTRAIAFYEKHGFRNTHFAENTDFYFIRDVRTNA